MAAAGALILVRLTASHFLWKMVRRVVGMLVRVGAGETSSQEFATLLSGRLPDGLEEGTARWTAPASGLFLERVAYPGEPPLPSITPAVPALDEAGTGHALYTGVVSRARPEHRARSVERP